MLQEERKLMQMLDKIILEGNPKKLAEIQQIDINTQLDGVWLYYLCVPIERASQNPDIKISKILKK